MVEIQRKLLRERALLRQWEKNSWVGGGGGGGWGGVEGDGEERCAMGFRRCILKGVAD